MGKFKQAWILVVLLLVGSLGFYLDRPGPSEEAAAPQTPIAGKRVRPHLDHSSFFDTPFEVAVKGGCG